MWSSRSRVHNHSQLGQGRSRSVDGGEISRVGAIVTYRFKSDPLTSKGPASFQAAVRSHDTFGPLLKQFAKDKKMQKLGSDCPELCLVPLSMYSNVRIQVRSGSFQHSDILVSLDLDVEFRRLLSSFKGTIELSPLFPVSPSRPDPVSDRRSQGSAGASSVESAHFRN